MDRAVVVRECLKLELHALLLRDQLVGTGANRLLQEPGLPHLFVIFRWHHPAGTADVGGSQQDGEVEERLLEVEPDGVVVDDLHAIGICFQNLTPGATVVLIAPFDVRRRDRRTVVELCAWPQRKGRALGVLGELVAIGECRMVVEFVTEVLDQAVVQCHQEIVRAGSAVVLLWIQPACRYISVPGENHLSRRLNLSDRLRRDHGRTQLRQCGGPAGQYAPSADGGSASRRWRRQSNPTRGAALFQHERALPARPSGPGRLLWFTTFAGRARDQATSGGASRWRSQGARH